ncbi:hypothetical protein AGLY_011849 [Aphis glycines]|uniref:Uncharacterized protein n=1 Tax=Aphis glycines TaxID=307491 RepID=A0A6G0TBC8_APHGL|nr:hypothetical protein AGLY_011849 [Aphis glycines]
MDVLCLIRPVMECSHFFDLGDVSFNLICGTLPKSFSNCVNGISLKCTNVSDTNSFVIPIKSWSFTINITKPFSSARCSGLVIYYNTNILKHSSNKGYNVFFCTAVVGFMACRNLSLGSKQSIAFIPFAFSTSTLRTLLININLTYPMYVNAIMLQVFELFHSYIQYCYLFAKIQTTYENCLLNS